MRTRIQPCHATTHHHDFQLGLTQISSVDVGDLELAACTGLQRSCDRHDLIVVEIQARHRVPRLRVLRFFLNAQHKSSAVELHYSVSLRIVYWICKDATSLNFACGLAQVLG